VICWSEDQATGFHDHDDSAAAILVIEGLCEKSGCGSARRLTRA
jgi:Cysteine dioxygenase type I